MGVGGNPSSSPTFRGANKIPGYKVHRLGETVWQIHQRGPLFSQTMPGQWGSSLGRGTDAEIQAATQALTPHCRRQQWDLVVRAKVWVPGGAWVPVPLPH